MDVFVYSLVEHLSCCNFLKFINLAAVNIWGFFIREEICFWFISLWQIPRSEMDGSYLGMFLALRNCQLFLHVIFLLQCIRIGVGMVDLLNFSHFSACVIVFNCGFN